MGNPKLLKGDQTGTRVFTYDSAYDDAKQEDLYEENFRSLVNSVLNGFNGTIFAYGQTGTGKTFTMEGVRTDENLKGVIPRSFDHIFTHISRTTDEQYLVRASYLEIYQEEIRDLLSKDQSKRLQLKERGDTGVQVKDLLSFVVKSASEIEHVMNVGNQNRSVRATNMNDHSSRSHAIFTIYIECSKKDAMGDDHIRVGRLNMVDLAGSERQTKTGATGESLKEATKINLSLSALGNVISALVDGKSSFIPYRNSKLTRLLQDSLGGNSKTLMIANFGPANYNLDETISTLRYANRAKNIKNKAVVNEDPKDALLRQMQEELEALRKQVQGVEGVGGGQVPSSQLAVMSQEILQQREALEKDREMVEKDKLKALNHLKKKEAEIEKTKEQQAELESKMHQIEQKVIQGGVNLLEKDEEQQRLLEESNREMQERIQQQNAMRRKIDEVDVTLDDINKKYATLQEEAHEKTRKLKKIWTMFNVAKSELADIEAENSRETESLLDNIRELEKSLKLKEMVIHKLIPIEMQELIKNQVAWNEVMGEWQLRGIAYTGNNMMRRKSP